MKALLTDIVPGRILYSVDCVDGRFCGSQAEFHAIPYKIIVFGKPYLSNINSLFFKCEIQFPGGGSYITVRSLHDDGVIPNHYNLHRLFTSYESAMNYIDECKTGIFSDPIDQEVYNNTSTKEYIKQCKIDDAWFDEMESALFDPDMYE